MMIIGSINLQLKLLPDGGPEVGVNGWAFAVGVALEATELERPPVKPIRAALLKPLNGKNWLVL